MTTRNAASMGIYNSTWQYGGYAGRGNVDELLGSLKGRVAIVCGGAECVFDDIRMAIKEIQNPVWFAANDIGMYLPRLDHWCSLHADHLGNWKAVRWQQQHEMERTKYHSATPRPVVDYLWEGLTPVMYLSGYFAMQVAYLMGCELIVLAGCPGMPMRRFFDLFPRDGFEYGGGESGSDQTVHEQILSEMARLPDFKSKVKSMSGYTRDFFGGL